MVSAHTPQTKRYTHYTPFKRPWIVESKVFLCYGTQKDLPFREVSCISFIGLIVCVLFLKRGQSSRMSFVCSESLIYSISIMEVRSYALSKACAKSSIISSIFSRPMDTRIISGVTPADFCCSSLSCACVVDAG